MSAPAPQLQLRLRRLSCIESHISAAHPQCVSPRRGQASRLHIYAPPDASAAPAAATSARAPPPGGWPPSPQRTEDVVYGRKFGVALTLDVFQPAAGVTPNGIGVIAVVSGGWFSDHAAIHPRGSNWKLLLARGYTVFAVCHGNSGPTQPSMHLCTAARYVQGGYLCGTEQTRASVPHRLHAEVRVHGGRGRHPPRRSLRDRHLRSTRALTPNPCMSTRV